MFDFFRDFFDVPAEVDMYGSFWGVFVLMFAFFAAGFFINRARQLKKENKGE